MHKKFIVLSLVSTLMLAACDRNTSTEASDTSNTETTEAPAPTDVATAETNNKFADWRGKWTGVEGMFVEITPKETGGYELVMQSDLDTLATYSGTDNETGIKFSRVGKDMILRKATGDETGLKYLAGKTDCLMVQQGEGYCR